MVMIGGHFCAHGRLMGRATSKGKEGKSKMKQPSDMPMLRFEHGGSDLWSNMLLLEHGCTMRKTCAVLSSNFFSHISIILINTDSGYIFGSN